MLDAIARIDRLCVERICLRRHPFLDSVMRSASWLGDGYIWAAIGLTAFFVAEQGQQLATAVVLGYFIEMTAYQIIKRVITRTRPFVNVPGVTYLVLPPDDCSFPSGHTAASFVITTIIGSVSLILLIPLLLVSISIGISRIYLGVHYPSDVAAGAALGFLAGLAGLHCASL